MGLDQEATLLGLEMKQMPIGDSCQYHICHFNGRFGIRKHDHTKDRHPFVFKRRGDLFRKGLTASEWNRLYILLYKHKTGDEKWPPTPKLLPS